MKPSLWRSSAPRTEQLYLSARPQAGDREAWLLQLPSHLQVLNHPQCPPISPQACATLVSALPAPAPLLPSLELLASLLLDQFPLLPGPFQGPACRALLTTLAAAPEEEGLAPSLLHRALLSSCSHPAPDPGQGEQDPGVVTVASFLPLWSGLLGGQEERVYDAMVSAILAIVERLDLTTEQEVEQEEQDQDISVTQSLTVDGSQNPLSGPSPASTSARPRKVRDHTVLCNLTSLALHALPLQPTSFHRWAPALWRAVSLWAATHPQVSAWYKLARLLLQEAGPLEEDESRLVAVFLGDVVARVGGCHEELELCCLHLLLDTPVSCLPPLLPSLPPVLASVLRLGCSLLPLAERGLATLLSWLQHLGEEALAPVLREALPRLRVFLATDFGALAGEGRVAGKGRLTRGPQRLDIKRLARLKVGEREAGGRVAGLAMLLLARLSSPYKLLVLPSEEELGEQAASWDLGLHLKLDLPLPDLVAPLHLDPLLPLLASLLEESPDRKVRVAAAELLHVVVVFMVGRSAGQTQELAALRPLGPLFSKLLPLLLRLSVDPDTVLQVGIKAG